MRALSCRPGVTPAPATGKLRTRVRYESASYASASFSRLRRAKPYQLPQNGIRVGRTVLYSALPSESDCSCVTLRATVLRILCLCYFRNLRLFYSY